MSGGQPQLILASMHGPQAMLGWLLGAVVALCDGLVWAELAAAMPDTGVLFEPELIRALGSGPRLLN